MPEELDEHRLCQLITAGRHVVSELDLDGVLQALLEDAREITGARYAAVGVLDSELKSLDRFITNGVDEETRIQIGDPPQGLGVLGELIRTRRPLRLENVSDHPASVGFPPGHPPMHSFLGTPIPTRGEPFGNLYLTEKRAGPFNAADEQAIGVLADWAGIAIQNAQSVAADRLRESIRSAERERGRWARELHDETLQGLGALQIVLASAARRPESRTLRDACDQAQDLVKEETTKLRSLISELRPAALDDIGLESALEGLVWRCATRSGLAVESSIQLEPGAYETLDAERQSAVYRIVQEALTNVERHARSERVEVTVAHQDGEFIVLIEDDGEGFDTGLLPSGFGLRGMHERAEAAGGTLAVESKVGHGSVIRVAIPASRERAESKSGARSS